MQILITYYLLIAVTFGRNPTAHAAVSPKDFPVVLDPGHGGSDFGAVYKSGNEAPFYEKTAVLNLALETAKLLRIKHYPVTLTRDSDQDQSLNARAQIANKARGKLFLSFHMNSAPTPHGLSQGGVETYILHTESTDGPSKRLAELENKGSGPDPGETRTGHRTVDLIVKDLRLSGFHEESMRLGCLIQEGLTNVTKQRHRGLKKAMFYVLLGADMPSALVEAGFVQSFRDRSLFINSHSLKSMSATLVRVIDQFRLNKRSKNCTLLSNS